jgi:hypothetical protein
MKTISIHNSTDNKKTAIVKQDDAGVYAIDFYDYDVGELALTRRVFEGKSIHFVEDAAENYTLGILDVDRTNHPSKPDNE